MSRFRNIRVTPHHGSRTGVLTWDLAPGTPAGSVFIAFSTTGTPASWTALNPDAGLDSTTVFSYHDETLQLNSGAVVGFYRLMLRHGSPSVDEFSEPVGIYGDLSSREFGIVRAIMYREFMRMRTGNGYPVWHCIPKDRGVLSPLTDPDTDAVSAYECPNVDPSKASYGLPYAGGFYSPVLTWIQPHDVKRGTITDHPEDRAVVEDDLTHVRMMAFPRPSRGHMIVDPTTDRRYLVGDTIKPLLFRGVVPVAYEADLDFLNQGDPRYRFPTPAIDTREYRRIR